MPLRFVGKLVKNETRNGVVPVGKDRSLHSYAFSDRAFHGEAPAIDCGRYVFNDNSLSTFWRQVHVTPSRATSVPLFALDTEVMFNTVSARLSGLTFQPGRFR